MFNVEDHDSIVLVRPLTDDVRSWLERYTLYPETIWFGGALVVEPRYVAPLVDALIEEGYAMQ